MSNKERLLNEVRQLLGVGWTCKDATLLSDEFTQGLDSIDRVEVVLLAEEIYNVELPDGVDEVFTSLSELIGLLEDKVSDKMITLPSRKPVPDPCFSIQTWDGEDHTNSAYNGALDDVEDILVGMGYVVKFKE